MLRLRPVVNSAIAIASFDGTQDYVDIAWGALIEPDHITPDIEVTDNSVGFIDVQITNRTSTGCRVNVSDRFTGKVHLHIKGVH